MTSVNRRDVQVLEPGLLRIESRTLVPRHEIGTDVSGPACIYSRVHVRQRRGMTARAGNLRRAAFLMLAATRNASAALAAFVAIGTMSSLVNIIVLPLVFAGCGVGIGMLVAASWRLKGFSDVIDPVVTRQAT